MSHTKEPWIVEMQTSGEIWILEADGNRAIARVMHGRSDAKECALRIAACVNACAGLDTDMLNNGWAISQAIEYIRAIQERDKAVAELAKIINSPEWDKFYSERTNRPQG